LSLFGFSVVFPGAFGHCGMSSFFLCIYQVVVFVGFLIFFWVPPGIWVELDCPVGEKTYSNCLKIEV
jgi:hypothetical protein